MPAPPRARCCGRREAMERRSGNRRAANGEVLHPPSGRRASYGQLADAAAKLPVPKDVALKQPADLLIGTPAKRLIRRRRSTAPRSSADVRLPGMLVAVIVNSPVFGGTVASVDDTAAKKIPGVRWRARRQRGGGGRRSHVGREARRIGARREVERGRGRESLDQGSVRGSRAGGGERQGRGRTQGRRRRQGLRECEDARRRRTNSRCSRTRRWSR